MAKSLPKRYNMAKWMPGICICKNFEEMMNDLVNQFKSAALSVGEYLTPVLRESKFKETGVLTPEEFIAAGDHLVHSCPTWSWAKAGDGTKTRDFLPAEKQFLITRQVPCRQRCSQMMGYDESKQKIIKEGGDMDGIEDEWVDTHHFDQQNDELAPKELPKADGINPLAIEEDGWDEEEDGGEALDLDEYLANGAFEEDDPARFVVRKEMPNDGDGAIHLEQTRRYDLHITYDKYYQVPRFWLVGYDEKGAPLTVDKMKEDFSQDHADKTITLESHPHIAALTLATIHPCRHAAVMKRLIEQFQENGKELIVLDYLFVFLKFVQAVIPAVEYDFTRSIQF